MVRQKVLLTGATGMLGKCIFEVLKGLSQFEVYPIARFNASNIENFIACDITDLDNFKSILHKLKPTYVIHCAANVNVNLCETDQDNSYALHVGVAAVIAAQSFIKKTIFISTDSVFDGKDGNYLPGNDKNPLNFYSKSKSLGEDEFIRSKQNAIIIRTNIIGYSIPFKNSLFEWGLKSLKEGKEIQGFSNILFNPLYVKTLANFLVFSILLEEIESGIYHFGSSDYYSKFDFLKLVASIFGYDQGLIQAVEANDAIQGVSRPLNTTLNVSETQRRLNIMLPTLEQEVVKMFKELN